MSAEQGPGPAWVIDDGVPWVDLPSLDGAMDRSVGQGPLEEGPDAVPESDGHVTSGEV